MRVVLDVHRVLSPEGSHFCNALGAESMRVACEAAHASSDGEAHGDTSREARSASRR